MNNMLFQQYTTDYISGVMSLRKPQEKSLKVLEDIVTNVNVKKDMNLKAALGAVNVMYPTCTDFERDFMSLTFALATGVGKTRLMGAFITYLYAQHGIKNFFVVAPGITVYDNFWNCREYVLFRDGHTCQYCKGKSKDKILNVHHIESRKTGGDAPNNLITLCETCHKRYHAGTVKLPEKIKRGASFKDAVFMGIMRWAFYNRLKDTFSTDGIVVKLTYGYKTKNIRIANHLEKSHCIDALCISGHSKAEQLEYYYFKKKVRCHNRQIHKMSIGKGGYRKRNQAPYEVKGFHLFDKVIFNGKECFIFGRRSDGRFAVRLIDGTRLNEQVTYKKLRLIESHKYTICERRTPLLIGASPDVPAAG